MVVAQLQERLRTWGKPQKQWQTEVRNEPRQIHVGNRLSTNVQQGISDINQCEWSLPVKTISKRLFLQQLSDGQKPDGNLISVKTVDDFHEIKDMKTALDNYDPLAVLINGHHSVGHNTRVSLKRGAQRMKFEEVTFVALGTPSQVPTPRQPTVANVTKFQPATKVTVRISAPAHYREAYLGPQEWDSAKSVLLELAQLKIAPASTWTGGSWQWNTVQRHHTLVGHMRLAPQVALALEAYSGRRGIFVTATGVTKRSEQVKWLRRADNADCDSHLRHCLFEAETRKQNLKFRMGGGCDLGILYLPNENVDVRPVHVLVQGIPSAWESTDLENFLAEQGWSQVQPLSRRPARKKFVTWIVKALAPNGNVANMTPNCTWHYVDNDDADLQIYVSKQNGRFPKPQHVRQVEAPKKRFHMDKPTLSSGEIPDVPMNEVVEAPRHEINHETSEASNDGRSRSRSPPRAQRKVTVQRTPSPKVAAHSVPQVKDEIETLKEEGYTEIDLGGSGDCGFRVVATGLAYNSDPTKVFTPDEARGQGAKLRGQAVTYCRKHSKDFIPFFCEDKDVSPEEPSLESQKGFDAWLQEMNLPHTWIDGLALKGLTCRTGMPIVIWRFSGNHWNRVTLAPSFSTDGWARARDGAQAVALLLRNQHYTWLKPPANEKLPDCWLKETSFPGRKELQGSGRSSCASPASLMAKKATSVAKTVSKSCSGASSKTPSVRTLRHMVKRTEAPSSSATPSVHTAPVRAQLTKAKAASEDSCSLRTLRPQACKPSPARAVSGKSIATTRVRTIPADDVRMRSLCKGVPANPKNVANARGLTQLWEAAQEDRFGPALCANSALPAPVLVEP